MRRATLSLSIAVLLATVWLNSATAAASKHVVPSSIDATGASDVSAALNRFIKKAPNGATIVFKAGGRYKLGSALVVGGKRNLTLDGNGARLVLPASYHGYDSIGIVVRRSFGTTIRDFTMVGNNSQAGTSDACCNREAQHGIAILSATDTLVQRVHIRRVWGDCLYVNAAKVPGGKWSRKVEFRNSTCRLTGRHGVGIIRGSNIRIVNNRFDEIGYMVVDIEPGASDAGADIVVFRNNNVGTYGLTDYDNSWLLAACGANGSAVQHVRVVDNIIEGNRSGWSGANGRPMKALHVRVCGEGTRVRSDFKVAKNTAKTKVRGPSLHFSRVRRVTVRGNKQPLTSGKLIYRTRPR